MTRWRFPSDTNRQHFVAALIDAGVLHEVTDDEHVEVPTPQQWCAGFAQDLGGEDVEPRDESHSSSGVDAFVDLDAYRRRGSMDVPFRDVSNQIASQQPALKSVKTRRRKTLGQP